MDNIFDTHAHYDDEKFEEDRDTLLSSLFDTGICGVINCGTDISSSKTSIALSKKYQHLYAAVGMWPHDVADAAPDWLEQTRGLAMCEKVVAIGEIGLDYYYDTVPRKVQIETFERQLELAAELDLPVIIHNRDAHEDTLHLLKKHHPKGVVHCFTGSVETAGEIIKLGMHIGLGGAVTFKNARKPVEVAQSIPLERLLLETDAPYMAPVPMRGQRCDSSMISYTAEKIAEVRGLDVQALIDQTALNAKQLFGIE